MGIHRSPDMISEGESEIRLIKIIVISHNGLPLFLGHVPEYLHSPMPIHYR